MNELDIQKTIELLKNDREFTRELLKQKTIKSVCEHLKKRGLDITPYEADKILDRVYEIIEREDDLSDDDLDCVLGG